MDVERARSALQWWIDTAGAAQVRGNDGAIYPWAGGNAPRVRELREREHQTLAILRRILGKEISTLLPAHTTANSRASLVDVYRGMELARYALGALDTEEETSAILGSSAPTMAADSMHPTVWEAAAKRWDSGQFSDAVQRAATFLNADVKDRVGRYDVSDKELMQEAFSLAAPAPGKSRLRWPGDDDDLSVKAMRVGILSYAQGVFSAIRNPATHGTDDLDRQEALEQLAALSTLARWIDKCELVTA